MPSPDSEELVDRPLLRRLAGEQSFARGEEYFSDGRVRQLRVGGDRVSARVDGSRIYRVKLWRRRGELQFRCDCADGQSEAFCKHCVAVGLAWISRPADDGPGHTVQDEGRPSVETASARREEERRALARYLRSCDRARLSALLLEATDFDDILRRRLLLEALGIAPAPGEQATAAESLPREGAIAVYRQLLHQAIHPCRDRGLPRNAGLCAGAGGGRRPRSPAGWKLAETTR